MEEDSTENISYSTGIVFPSLIDYDDDEDDFIDIEFERLAEIPKWKDIQLFSEIDICMDKKTIVFCDIDDTLLHHPIINPAWTSLILSFFKTRSRNRTLFFNNSAYATKKYDDYMDQLLASKPMMHTDKDGFFAMADKVAKLVFVTARPKCSEKFTRDNLESIGVDTRRFEVHFSDRENKGSYIKRNFDLSEYERVIFIDDQRYNLEAVFSALSDADLELELYRFYRVKEDPYVYYPFPDGFPSKYRFNGYDLEIWSEH